MIKILFFLCLGLLCISCHTTRSSPIEEKSELRAGPHILFASFQFTNDNVSVVSKLITKGQLKPSRQEDRQLAVEDLVLVELDIDKQILGKHELENPRRRKVEYVNDDGKLESQIVEVADAQFTFRIQLHEDTQVLDLKEWDGQKEINLMTIDLNES